MLEELLHIESKKVTNLHYNVEIFLAVINAILLEMNQWFTEISSELLVCMASLNPRSSFSNFNVDRLVSLLKFMLKISMLRIFYCYRANLRTLSTVLGELNILVDVKNFQKLLKLWLRRQCTHLTHWFIGSLS